MSTPRSRPAASDGLFTTLAGDVREVVADVQNRGFERAVGDSIEALESFYLTEDDRKRLSRMGSFKRFMIRSGWLLRSLLLKLTPARRILLAFAIFFLIVGAPHIGFNTNSFRVDVRIPWISSLCLLAVLMLELKDKLVARDELEAGRAVQLALMPEQSPAVPGWQIWLYTRPANDVGGDLVDHLQIDEQHHAVALGDVAGKALPAALLSVKLQATLRALAPRFDALGDLGVAVNDILYRDGLPTRFASLVYLLITAGAGRVRVLNAGHMPPLVVRDGTVTPMERGSMVLGIMPEARFNEQAIELNAGDLLIVYSDGVTEAMNQAGDFFGDDRLLASVQASAHLAPAPLGERVLGDVKAFIKDAVPNDDLSLMVLKRVNS